LTSDAGGTTDGAILGIATFVGWRSSRNSAFRGPCPMKCRFNQEEIP